MPNLDPTNVDLDLWERFQTAAQTALRHGGNGGNNGGMDRVEALEKRLDKFEGKFDALHKDVVDLRVQMATLTEKVAHLPGKGFIVTSTLSALTLVAAIVLFGQKIIALIG